MEFGVHFFPDRSPDQQSAQAYFNTALNLVELGEQLGYSYARIVEHYFTAYGGYSPNPLLFLAAASQRTSNMRLMTGAVLPVFSNPLKMAGEIGMLDSISNGRLELGVARAFLPFEFDAFGISMSESRSRFNEGLESITRLLTQERASFEGKHIRFSNIVSLPKPVQQSMPPVWIAAVRSEESFYNAGVQGHNLMVIPYAAEKLKPLLDVYRKTFREHHPDKSPKIMIGFHMYCHAEHETAMRSAAPYITSYIKTMASAFEAWQVSEESKDYQGYKAMVEKISNETFESMMASGALWVGSPESIRQRAKEFYDAIGGYDVASLQVLYGGMPEEEAKISMTLFAEEAMPNFNMDHKRTPCYA